MPSPLVTFNPVLLFSEVASELLLRESGTFKNNFKVVPVEKYEACSCKKLTICMFSLNNWSKVLNFRFSPLLSMPNNKWLIKEERGRSLENLFGSEDPVHRSIHTSLSKIWNCSIAVGSNSLHDLGNCILILEIKIMES